MKFPVELDRAPNNQDLILKVSSLPIFGGRPVIVPEDKVTRRGFFDLTTKYLSENSNWTIQMMEEELLRRGLGDVNAYRVIRRRKFTQEKPYREMETTTFQSYQIPEELAQEERKNAIGLARSCTS